VEKECKEYSGVYKGRVLEEYKRVQSSTVEYKKAVQRSTRRQYSGVQRKQYSGVHRRQHSGVQEGSTVEYKKAVQRSTRRQYSGLHRRQYSGVQRRVQWRVHSALR